jgi:hypothetical protein
LSAGPLDISSSGNTNEDDSQDRGVDAAIQCNTFEIDSIVAPPLCTIFLDGGVDTDGNTLSRCPLIDAGSRLAIYFQIVNRLRTKTTDLFKAVLEDDYDVIVLLKTSLVSSFHDDELYTWLQMSGSVPSTYWFKALKLSRTTVTSVTSFWFSETSICRKSDGRLT